MPRALILSPFATVKADAGQRLRVRQVTRLLQAAGYEITFILYAFEDGWKSRANEPWLAEMRKEWGEVIVWGSWREMGTPPKTGNTHQIDEWWDVSLEGLLTQTFAYRHFDVFVVNNVWLSKAFEFAPNSTVKALDTHDIFSRRQSSYQHLNAKPEFFYPDEEAEIAGLRRADLVLGIQADDAAWLAEKTTVPSLCLPYCPEPHARSARSDYLNSEKVTFGLLSSYNVFNAAGLRAFLPELKSAVGSSAAPAELMIGGSVCGAVDGEGPWTTLGYVDDEDSFYANVDIIVAPVFEGSGFKVKTADAIARGMPLLAADHAAIGLSMDANMKAASPRQMADRVVQIALNRPRYADLQDLSASAFAELKARTEEAGEVFLSKIRTMQHVLLYDLSPWDPLAAAAVLLSWSGAFRLLHKSAKQVVVVPDALMRELSNAGLPGTVFTTLEEVRGERASLRVCVTSDAIDPPAASTPIHLDRYWAAVLNPTAGPSHSSEGAAFWHNINWGNVAKFARRYIIDHTHWPTELQPAIVIVAAARRTTELAPLLRRSLGDNFIALDIGERDTFLALLARIADRQVEEVIVADDRFPDRNRMLLELCGAMETVKYAGAIDNGCIKRESDPLPPPLRLWQAFDLHWQAVLGRIK